MVKLNFRFIQVPEGIIESECSGHHYWKEDETVERLEREFLPGLTLYRYHDFNDRIFLYKFKAIRETEASYLVIDNEKERWVRKGAMRSFCYDNKKDAWRNFTKRKEKQLKLLKGQVNRIEEVLRTIKKIEEKNEQQCNQRTEKISA